jgi:hypothetical protein
MGQQEPLQRAPCPLEMSSWFLQQFFILSHFILWQPLNQPFLTLKGILVSFSEEWYLKIQELDLSVHMASKLLNYINITYEGYQIYINTHVGIYKYVCAILYLLTYLYIYIYIHIKSHDRILIAAIPIKHHSVPSSIPHIHFCNCLTQQLRNLAANIFNISIYFVMSYKYTEVVSELLNHTPINSKPAN